MTVSTSDIRREVARVFPQIRALRRDLHRHPGVKFDVGYAAGQVVRHLKKLGIPCRERVGRSGVVALLKGAEPGPCVALRADMDALPLFEESRAAWRSRVAGAMHACGHDGHMANLVGVAHVLAHFRNAIAGSVKFIFQPAEESGDEGGAALMIKDGALASPKPSLIYALHSHPAFPVGTIGVSPGRTLAAADFFDIVIRGRGSHAAYPHLGVDPVVISAAVIDALQTIASRRIDPFEPVVVTVGRVSAGTARNIIPEEALLSGTCRSCDAGVRRKVAALVKQIPRDVARARGGSARVNFMFCYPPVVNDARAAEALRAAAVEALGASRVRPSQPSMGGEDFAFFLERVPGALFWLGNGRPTRQLHQPTFDFNDEALKTGMLVMSTLALRRCCSS